MEASEGWRAVVSRTHGTYRRLGASGGQARGAAGLKACTTYVSANCALELRHGAPAADDRGCESGRQQDERLGFRDRRRARAEDEVEIADSRSPWLEYQHSKRRLSCTYKRCREQRR